MLRFIYHLKSQMHRRLQLWCAGFAATGLNAFPLQGFNLLPYRHIHALRHRRWRRNELALAALAGLMTASALQYPKWRSTMRDELHQKKLQQTLDGFQPQLTESQRLNALITAHQQRASAVVKLTSEKLALATLFNELVQLDKPNVVITQLKMERGISTLSGVVSDHAALSNWVRALKQTGRFANVEITQVQHHISTPNAVAIDAASDNLSFSVQLTIAADFAKRPTSALNKVSAPMPRASIQEPYNKI